MGEEAKQERARRAAFTPSPFSFLPSPPPLSLFPPPPFFSLLFLFPSPLPFFPPPPPYFPFSPPISPTHPPLHPALPPPNPHPFHLSTQPPPLPPPLLPPPLPPNANRRERFCSRRSPYPLARRVSGKFKNGIHEANEVHTSRSRRLRRRPTRRRTSPKGRGPVDRVAQETSVVMCRERRHADRRAAVEIQEVFGSAWMVPRKGNLNSAKAWSSRSRRLRFDQAAQPRRHSRVR